MFGNVTACGLRSLTLHPLCQVTSLVARNATLRPVSPNPQTPNHTHHSPDPRPQNRTPNSEPQTPNRKLPKTQNQTPNAEPSPEPQTTNPISRTPNPKPSRLYTHPFFRNLLGKACLSSGSVQCTSPHPPVSDSHNPNSTP